jgi:hypothetical protein
MSDHFWHQCFLLSAKMAWWFAGCSSVGTGVRRVSLNDDLAHGADFSAPEGRML